MSDAKDLHKKVKEILYSLTGITLAENKDIMIANRLEKLKRDTSFSGDIQGLLNSISNGSHITEFINSFTTNKTHFFREDFHFIDLRDRVLKDNNSIKIYCSASSTGEEPYSIAMTVKEAESKFRTRIDASVMATDIDTNVLQYGADGIYRFSKSAKEFPDWIKPQKYFKKRVTKGLASQETLIKVKDELKKLVTFAQMNLNDDSYPFEDNEFDIIFCRNVLIYFSAEDQNLILRKLFNHLKIGGTLYIGHSENPHSLVDFVKRAGQNIFVKERELL